MGLIQATGEAAASSFADAWREFFYCEALPADVLVQRAFKRTGKRSSNTKGHDNIISNGSIVAVADGQCMVIVDQGQVVELCAEPGEFVWDASSEPSIFYGSLGSNILNTFKKIGRRIAFGGDTAHDQRVYYINTKEIPGNKYGTANPVPFRVVDRNIGLDVDISIRCHGEYSYHLMDPILFYTNVAGNVSEDYKRDMIDSQLKTELMTALQPAFAKISEMGIRYSALPGHTLELADALNDVLSQKWSGLRGIEVVSFGVDSVTASPEDEQMIKNLQKSAVLRDPTMAAATLTGAQAEAMVAAANNSSAGPMMAFAGMNMAGQAGGMNAANLFAMGQQQAASQSTSGAPVQAAGGASGWTCSCGQTGNTGRFCTGCGQPKPQPAGNAGWTCSCGTDNTGKFCQNCGKPRPNGNGFKWKCDKCGWEPEDPNNIPKFCPNCGDPFNEADKVEL
ncbi:MAG: SPFH domain-containing protein [Lachnospiraceae bacterium]|nr:SPFH domain-containing protein [Lachnospiraceae bacterium]